MLNKTKMGLGCTLAILASPVPAQNTPKPAPVSDGDKVICTREIPTNTRFAKKVCMTKAQRDAIAERDRQNFNDTQMKSALNANSGG